MEGVAFSIAISVFGWINPYAYMESMGIKMERTLQNMFVASRVLLCSYGVWGAGQRWKRMFLFRRMRSKKSALPRKLRKMLRKAWSGFMPATSRDVVVLPQKRRQWIHLGKPKAKRGKFTVPWERHKVYNKTLYLLYMWMSHMFKASKNVTFEPPNIWF